MGDELGHDIGNADAKRDEAFFGTILQQIFQFGTGLKNFFRVGQREPACFGKAAGKTFGKAGSAATGMAFSFATTYALGQVARRYYAGGRVMSTELLRASFQDLLGPAKQMQTQYLPEIQQKAATLDAGQVMALIRA